MPHKASVSSFCHPVNATNGRVSAGACRKNGFSKKDALEKKPKNHVDAKKDLPPSTMTDLNRTSISRCIFWPQISWCSQEQPKSGLRIPKTATETPTAVSPMFCVCDEGRAYRYGSTMILCRFCTRLEKADFNEFHPMVRRPCVF